MHRLIAFAVRWLRRGVRRNRGDGGTRSPLPPLRRRPTRIPASDAAVERRRAPTGVAGLLPAQPHQPRADILDGTSRYRVLDALWLHQQQAGRAPTDRPAARSDSAADVGDIAVIQDQGDVILRPNAFDLTGAGTAIHAQQRRRIRRADGSTARFARRSAAG